MADGIAILVDEVKQGISDAARREQVGEFRRRDEAFRQRGGMRADIAATDDRQIHLLGEVVDRLQPAFFDQGALRLDGIDEQRGQEHVAFRAELACQPPGIRSEEHTSELQSLMRISYAVFCLKTKKTMSTKSSRAR